MEVSSFQGSGLEGALYYDYIMRALHTHSTMPGWGTVCADTSHGRSHLRSHAGWRSSLPIPSSQERERRRRRRRNSLSEWCSKFTSTYSPDPRLIEGTIQQALRMHVISIYFRLNVSELYNGPIRLLADHDFTVRCIQVESITQGRWMVPLILRTPVFPLPTLTHHMGFSDPLK